MKFKIFVIIVLFSSFTCDAQLSIGGEFGLNYGKSHYLNVPSNTTSRTVIEAKSQVGFFGSFVPKFHLSKKAENTAMWSFVLPMQVSLEKYEDIGNVDIKRSYFRLLPQLEVKFKSSGFFAGANIGMLLNHKSKNKDKWEKVSDDSSKFDSGVVSGFKYYWSKYYFLVSYQHGLKDIAKYFYFSYNGPRGIITQRNRYLQLGFGYWIE